MERTYEYTQSYFDRFPYQPAPPDCMCNNVATETFCSHYCDAYYEDGEIYKVIIKDNWETEQKLRDELNMGMCLSYNN